MLRYLMKLRHKKGFTLTELIVVCAIIGILMVSLAAFSAPVRMMIKGVDAKSDCLTINKTIGDYLEHMLAYANDITIFAGVDISESNTYAAINKAFTDMQGTYDLADGKDRCAALIFRYDSQSDVLKSGHRIYEISGRKSGSGAVKKNIPTSLTSDNLLFYGDFYGPYSYFLAADAGNVKNSTRQQNYLKLTVKSYYFDGSDVDDSGDARYIAEDDIESYYIHQDTNSWPDEMAKKNNSASGTEEVFFPLQNISWGSDITYSRGYNNGAGTTTYGDDVVIIYNVRTLKFTSS